MTKTRARVGVGALVVLAVIVAIVVVGDTAASQTSGTQAQGEQIVGSMTINGISGSIDLRGVSFGATGATAAATGSRVSPGSIGLVQVVKDVDKTSTAIMQLALRSTPPSSVRIDVFRPDGSGTVAMTLNLTQPRLASVAIAHEGRAGERVLETIAFDVSGTRVTMTAEGNTLCWDTARGATC